jgi:hypothetical protein
MVKLRRRWPSMGSCGVSAVYSRRHVEEVGCTWLGIRTLLEVGKKAAEITT